MSTSTLDSRGLPPGAALKANEIAPRDLAALLKGEPGRTLVIDVRTKGEWDTARIAGAVHVPVDELESRFEELPLDGARHVALLCHHGVRSLRGSDILRAKGCAHAKSIFGGIDLWSQAVDPGVPRYERSRLTGACTIRR